MTRRRQKLLVALALVLLAGGGFAWYWRATAVDRQVTRLKLDPSGNLRDIYHELAATGLADISFMDNEFLQRAISSLKEAAYVDPPDPPQRPSFSEIYWAFHSARLREGQWRPYLGQLYRTADYRSIEPLMAVAAGPSHMGSRELWFLLKNCDRLPHARYFWGSFASRFGEEARRFKREMYRVHGIQGAPRFRPPGSPRPRRAPKPSKPYVPDWDYLNAEDMWRVVTREATYFRPKWKFLSSAALVRDKGDQWKPTVARLRAWIIEQASRETEGRLRQLQDGTRSGESFRQWAYELGPVASTVLAECVERGPEDPLAPAVRQWLLHKPHWLARERAICSHLPQWIAKFPELEAVRKQVGQDRAAGIRGSFLRRGHYRRR